MVKPLHEEVLLPGDTKGLVQKPFARTSATGEPNQGP